MLDGADGREGVAVLGAIEPVLVPTPAGAVAVHVLGAGRPTVLWHDVLVDGSSWGYLLPALLPGRRLLVVDGPGWGRSRRAPLGVDDRRIGLAAAAVTAALAPGAAVDWVGNGWGGRVGIAVAAARPDLVRSLVAVAADPEPMPPVERAALRRVLAGLRVIGPVGPIGRALVADRLVPGSRTEPQTVGAVLDALLLAGRLGAARSTAAFDLRRRDLSAALSRVTAPTLLVAGDAASGWTEPDAERAAALAPLARVAVVPGARRLVPLDQPAALARTITAFWAGLAGG